MIKIFMFNTFGKYFTFTTWGESHGLAIGVVIDGVPSNIELSEKDIQPALDLRKPGNNPNVSTRKEKDNVQILSGVFEGKTTGTPISCIIYNKDHKSEDYSLIKNKFRPSHGDYVYSKKYGNRDYRGGGRASARETATRVIAGAVAKKILLNFLPEILINSKINRIGDKFINKLTDIEIENYINSIRNSGDSIGGEIETTIKNVPVGIGEPIYQKLSSRLAEAIFTINAVKSFEVGIGKGACEKTGSSNNDQMIISKNNKIEFLSNNDGGIVAGISNGQDIIIRCVFKPTPSILMEQKTVTTYYEDSIVSINGRHDPCIVLRAATVVESMIWCVLLDLFLLNKTRKY